MGLSPTSDSVPDGYQWPPLTDLFHFVDPSDKLEAARNQHSTAWMIGWGINTDSLLERSCGSQYPNLDLGTSFEAESEPKDHSAKT